MKKQYLFSLVVAALLVFSACSEDDSNPSDPTPVTPESAGTYSGTNHMDTTMSITIDGVDGNPYVTSYNVDYKLQSSGNSVKGTYSSGDAAGIAEVSGNSFELSLGTFDGDYLRGTVNGDQISGSYRFVVLFYPDTVEGTYTISR